MANFFREKSVAGIGQMAMGSREEVRIGGMVLTVKERIAEGGFGFVDLVTDASSRDFVLKRCSLQRKESFEIVQKEINMLQKFAGDYVIKLLGNEIIGRHSSSPEALLLLEFCPGGHLLDRLLSRNGTKLNQEEVMRIFGMLLQALLPMHASNPPIIHRDIKLENVLFGVDGKVRLIDFGSAQVGYMNLRTAEDRSRAEEDIGKNTTQMYRSPEMIDLYMRDILTEKTDIWALGCLYYALCFLMHPFQDAGNLGILSAKITIPNDNNVSADAKSLIPRMLDVDPEARPSIPELLDCARALLTGQPMPQLTVPEAVIQRRKEREENERRRAQLLASKQKKVSPAYAPRNQPVQLDSNSVAARRLAAKRGETISGPPVAVLQSALVTPNNFQNRAYDQPEPDAAESFGHVTSDNFFGNAFSSGGLVSPAADSLFFDGADDNPPQENTQTIEKESAKSSGMKKLFGAVELEVEETSTPSNPFDTSSSFDHFSASSVQQAHLSPFDKPSAAADMFDPFDSSRRVSFGDSSRSGEVAQPPAPFNSFSSENLFNAATSTDPFTTTSRPSSLLRPSISEQPSNTATFDPFAMTSQGHDPFAAYSSEPSSVQQTAASSSSSTAIFDPFNSTVSDTTASSFDPFADSPSLVGHETQHRGSNNSTFLDDFTSSTPQRNNVAGSAQVLSLFDQPSVVQPSSMMRRGSASMNNYPGNYGTQPRIASYGSYNSGATEQSSKNDPFGSLGVLKK